MDEQLEDLDLLSPKNHTQSRKKNDLGKPKMHEISALGPIDPTSVPEDEEEEKAAPWIMRTLVGSMPGRIVMSSYETLRATGTTVVCLSPWGDSSPLFLPCIRFRDLVVEAVITATGGMAAVAAPVMDPVAAEVADDVVSSFGDTILVELGLYAGHGLGHLIAEAADELVPDKLLEKILPIHSSRLETTSTKDLLITLRHKHTMSDAKLGFYRSSFHSDTSLFASVKDYFAIEKGWFSPYLFATARRPIIPRTIKPDVIFCSGPFLSGDHKIGETLMNESTSVICLCDAPPPAAPETSPGQTPEKPKNPEHKHSLSMPSFSKLNILTHSRPPSPEPALAPHPAPPVPKRLVILLVGIKPHRKVWALSARPGESVIHYVLLNGCPAIVVPAKLGAPILAWDTLTLEKLWDVELPPLPAGANITGTRSASGKFEGIVNVIFEYLDHHVDWERFVVPGAASPGDVGDVSKEKQESGTRDLGGKSALKNAVALLVAAAIRSKTNKEVKKELDADRSGIAMWRIP